MTPHESKLLEIMNAFKATDRSTRQGWYAYQAGWAGYRAADFMMCVHWPADESSERMAAEEARIAAHFGNLTLGVSE